MGLSGETRLLGVIGHPIAHSLSPRMHNASFAATGLDYIYLPLDVRPETLATAVAGLGALGFRGFNVTMPHKEEILTLLDGVDAAARLTGAVNTVVVEGDRLLGTNTDGPGFLEACAESGVAFAGARVLVVGAGGAAAAISAAVLGAGARHVGLLNRSAWRAEELRTRLAKAYPRAEISVYPADEPERAAQGAGVIVNATYLGMKDGDPPPVASRRGWLSATRSTGAGRRPGSCVSRGSGVSRRSRASGCCSTRAFRPRGSGPERNPTWRR